MSRNPSDLHPLIRPLCLRHMDLFGARHPELLVILSFTWRSFAEQDELFFRGRNAAGEVVTRRLVVTNARGGQSWHNVERDGSPASLAYDILLMDGSRRVLADGDSAWQDLGYLGLSLGLDWGVINRDGGRWDLGHFYLRGTNRISLEEAISGIEPVVGDILVRDSVA